MRVLLVGGGARGRRLTRALRADGHAVRAVTRTEAGRAAIEETGAECWIGTPDAVGTLRYALENVTILIWALGTASGVEDERLEALHGSRLRMMLEKTTDTTVRGVLYEASGTLDPAWLRTGVEEVERANRLNEIPYRILDADPADEEAWTESALSEIDALLAVKRGPG